VVTFCLKREEAVRFGNFKAIKLGYLILMNSAKTKELDYKQIKAVCW